MTVKIHHITDFSPMLNVLDDARDIAPIADFEPAECIQADNVEPVGTSLITSPGYAQVTTVVGATTGGIKMLMNYEKAYATRQLIVAHDDEYYYMPSNTTVLS